MKSHRVVAKLLRISGVPIPSSSIWETGISSERQTVLGRFLFGASEGGPSPKVRKRNLPEAAWCSRNPGSHIGMNGGVLGNGVSKIICSCPDDAQLPVWEPGFPRNTRPFWADSSLEHLKVAHLQKSVKH